MRSPIVAGSFYPADKKELEAAIKESFLGKFGCGMPSGKGKKVYGVVSPHAGYMYSGQAAAHAYKAIAGLQADTFIMLGTNHTGYAESNFAVSTQDFETPLGIVKNDEEFSKLLISEFKGKRFSVGETSGDKLAHQQEHSIEVQLPFLQFIFDKIKIVPIICQIQDYENYAEFAKLIVNAAKKLERKICVIASSDFTHYGASYGLAPFDKDVKKNLYKLDNDAINCILNFKTKEFLEKARKTTICGAGAVAVAIETCKLLGSRKAELLTYYTSGDIVGDYSSAVGYAAISFC
jgi:AmmeMemoRadiSam system protein B